ncbi:helix-turn-helix domain-containing protein [Niallia taxi]|uniref:Helix-turn-helix domain-containing protein n=2 Tax=Niallia TaxID=2837506 RepID=A0A3S2TSD3_9BACI|nr:MULTISPECIES: helix-turn-helix domain-containing protein [Niallia]MCM3217369.1 helix-turn-helix domain-containing protein [Niallia taxi]MCT2343749.1 helix-turn-helix domain-containing protein [Niallia taxi]MDE5055547.1 helix-turn-helix domain-containing protein [Niallia taxi]MDK8641436.1 helix-turn-helix domain-containing protein [Niallia taxi]MED3965378.1 helix-turn-helix domain-containing protein [Niallia taxi]
MVGTALKRLRLEKGYSINELSDRAGVSKSYLSYIERGIQKNPSLQVLSKLASTLDTHVEELLETNPTSTDNLDSEWVNLVEEAIKEGITKDEFSCYLEFIKFKKSSAD